MNMKKSSVVSEKNINVTEENSLNLVRFIVQTFEINDSAKPSCYIVGFKLICDINQREQYLETQLDFKLCDGKSDNEICTLAYSNLKPKLDQIKTELFNTKFIVGSEFVPPIE